MARHYSIDDTNGVNKLYGVSVKLLVLRCTIYLVYLGYIHGPRPQGLIWLMVLNGLLVYTYLFKSSRSVVQV